MKNAFKAVSVFFLLYLILLITGCGDNNESPQDVPENPPDLSQLSTLLLTLATRPNITDQAVIDILTPATEQGAEVFVATLDDRINPELFLNALTPIIKTYTAEYQSASSGLPGAEDKALALNRLYDGLLDAADQGGISFQVFETALLSAFASLEAALSAPLSEGSISDLDHELVDLLLLHSINDLNQRGYYKYLPNSFVALDANPASVDLLRQMMNAIPDQFIPLSKSLEELLADPASLSDSTTFVQGQFNEEAIRDLTLMKLNLGLFVYQPDITQIIERMDTMGGVMAGMTAARLSQAGFANWFSDSYVLLWNEFAAYNWVQSARPTSYQPDLTLADELQQLGLSVPTPPDFSILSGPYLAMAQLIYDLNLCRLISDAEFYLAADEYFTMHNQVPTMQMRLEVRQADMTRRQQVLGRLIGATDEEKQALDLLLTAFSR